MKLQLEMKALMYERQIFQEYESIFMERRVAKDNEIADLKKLLADDQDDQLAPLSVLSAGSPTPAGSLTLPPRPVRTTLPFFKIPLEPSGIS